MEGAIAVKWRALGGASGILGEATALPTCDGAPCRQEFVGGMVFDLGVGGATVVYRTSGHIGPYWFATGAMASGLGYPTTDEKASAAGVYQDFDPANGRSRNLLTWRARYGIIPILENSEMGYGWSKRGGFAGMGFPTTKESCGLRNSGCSQDFDGGLIIASATSRGFVKGGIRSKWQSMAAQNGILGYPSGDESCLGAVRTCVQNFQGGTLIWSAKTGAVVVRGGIYSRYWAEGFLQGFLGLPLKDEVCKLRDGGCVQTFQHGQIMWSSTTSAHAVKGGIGSRYNAAGAQNGFLRYPLTEEVCIPESHGCKQYFQGGDILWSAKSGAHTLHGAIRTAYKHGYDYLIGPEGYPTGEEVCGQAQGGCYQQFQIGRYYWSPKAGPAQLVWGGLLSKWNGLGGPQSRVGYPTWIEVCAGGYCEQQFQYGRLSWSAPGAVPW